MTKLYHILLVVVTTQVYTCVKKSIKLYLKGKEFVLFCAGLKKINAYFMLTIKQIANGRTSYP